MTKKHVIIAHYNEDLYWTKNLIYPYTVISKHNLAKDVAPNKGNEASSYLQYIITNYENLPDICIFVHGHRNDWHHKQNIDEKINCLDFCYNYYNINELCLNQLDSLNNAPVSLDALNRYINLFNDILNKTIIVENLKYRASAQFYVKKNNILINSKETYIKLYMFLMTTDVVSFWSGRFFEYLWHFIFTHEHEDTL